MIKKSFGRPLREGVGRNLEKSYHLGKFPGRPLREGVGRNTMIDGFHWLCIVALYARAWVEMLLCRRFFQPQTGRPLREGVGRNPDIPGCVTDGKGRPLREGVGRNRDMLDICHGRYQVALYARAWVEIGTFERIGKKIGSPSTRGRG